MKLDVGSVLFEFDRGNELEYRCGRFTPMGDERIVLLRKFYRGEEVPFVDQDPFGQRTFIKRELEAFLSEKRAREEDAEPDPQ